MGKEKRALKKYEVTKKAKVEYDLHNGRERDRVIQKCADKGREA